MKQKGEKAVMIGVYDMIGFYSYTVVLTYMGLASAALGMILTVQGFAKYALFCLTPAVR